MLTEQKIRAILFYISLSVFFLGLPFILSFALGYKFNPRTFSFTKTGIIVLKTQPEGAAIFLDRGLLKDKTPATIRDLLPGNYDLVLELDKHYSWAEQVNVEAGKVTRLDKIILFPLRPNIKQLNKDKISSFWVDQKEAKIYYFSRENNTIYISNLEGEDFEEEGSLPQDFSLSREWKISGDRQKLAGFNPRQVVVAYLDTQNSPAADLEAIIVLDRSEQPIRDIFWHSDNYHLILVTERSIGVLEARPQASIVNLVNLNKKNAVVSYDDSADILYFTDAQKAADGKWYDNLYKLELSVKFSPLEQLIKPRADE